MQKSGKRFFSACFDNQPHRVCFRGKAKRRTSDVVFVHTHTDLREELHRVQARLHRVELKRSLEEVVAKAYIQYSRSQRTVSEKRRKLKKRLKAVYGYEKEGKIDGHAQSSDRL